MFRIISLIALVIVISLPAIAQDAPDSASPGKPAGKKPGKEDEVFGHPGWPKLNTIEEKVVDRIDDLEKLVESHMRAGQIRLIGELIRNNRRALRQFIIDHAIERIVFRLNGDHYFEVRKQCPDALAQICGKSSIEDLISFLKEKEKVLEKEIEKASNNQDKATKEVALQNLKKQREEVKKATDKQTKTVKEALLKALKEDKKNVVREQCAGFLPQIVIDKKVVNALAHALLNDKWSIVRAMAVNSLVTIGDPSCIDALRKALTNDLYSTVRAPAADALVKFEDKDSVSLFIKGLSDSYSRVRIACARALASLGTAKATKPLTKLLSDRNIDARMEAALALGKVGDRSALPELKKALEAAEKPEFQPMRITLYGAIAGIGKRVKTATKEAGDMLAKTGLSDKRLKAKMAAVEGLISLDDPRAIKGLIDVLNEAQDWLKIPVLQTAIENNVKDKEFAKAVSDLTKSDKISKMVKDKANEYLKGLKE